MRVGIVLGFCLLASGCAHNRQPSSEMSPLVEACHNRTLGVPSTLDALVPLDFLRIPTTDRRSNAAQLRQQIRSPLARLKREIREGRIRALVQAERSYGNITRTYNRVNQHGQNWAPADLSPVMSHFFPQRDVTCVIEGSKVIYTSPTSNYVIVEDPIGQYFRISTSRTRYLQEGTHFCDLTGKTVTGPDYQAQTHFSYSNFVPNEELIEDILDSLP